MTTYDDKVAASMGYYWHEDGWDEQALTSAGLPVALLPQVCRSLEGNLDLLGYLVVKGSGVVYFVSRFMATLRKIIVKDNGVRFAKAEI